MSCPCARVLLLCDMYRSGKLRAVKLTAPPVLYTTGAVKDSCLLSSLLSSVSRLSSQFCLCPPYSFAFDCRGAEHQ